MQYLRRMLVIITMAIVAVAAHAQTGHELFQRALSKERAEGNLQEAIRLYARIVEEHGSNRALAVKALFQMGQCYERLGKAEAQKAYERIVREFGDQAEASEARARLTALRDRKPPDETRSVANLLLTSRDMNLNNFLSLRISPDGRRVAYSEVGHMGALCVRELASGETTRLVEGEFTFSPVWSPDGKKLVYVGSEILRSQPFRFGDSALKILDVKSRAVSVLVRLDRDDSLNPLDWSPDGRQLLASLTRGARGANVAASSLVLVSAGNGDIKTLIEEGWRRNSRATFSPDGRYIALAATVDENEDIFVLKVNDGRKTRITTDPKPDHSPLWSPSGDSIIYQRQDGLWAIKIKEGSSVDDPWLLRRGDRMSVQPVDWTINGGLAYILWNAAGGYYTVPVDPATGQNTGDPVEVISAVGQPRFAWSPDMQWIATSRPDEAAIYLYSPASRTFRSLPTGMEGLSNRPMWLWWSQDGKHVFFVPTGEQGGRVYSLDIEDGSVRPLFDRIPHTERFHISPDGRHMVFYRGRRGTGERKMVLAELGQPDGLVLAGDEGSEEGILSNWVRPMFSPDGSWIVYGRLNDEEDTLWVVSRDGASRRKIATVARGQDELGPGGQETRAFLQFAVWDPTGKRVAYSDGHSLNVVEVATGAARRLVLPPNMRWMSVHDWSPDGKQIAFVSGMLTMELWTLHNPLDERPEQAAKR